MRVFKDISLYNIASGASPDWGKWKKEHLKSKKVQNDYLAVFFRHFDELLTEKSPNQ